MKNVSVVIPFFNRSLTIKRAINSIFISGNKEYIHEVIIIDDNSSIDEYSLLEAIIVDYSLLYSDVKFSLLRMEKNKNAAYCRNVGIEKSQSQYIAFLDSDDEWLERKLQKQFPLVNSNNIVFCQYRKLNLSKNKVSNSLYPLEYDEKNVAEYIIKQNGHIQTSGILCSKEVATKILFNSSLWKYQDWEFAIRASHLGIDFIFLKEPLVNYYIDSSNRIGSDYSERHLDNFVLSISKFVSPSLIKYLMESKKYESLIIQKRYLTGYKLLLSKSFTLNQKINFLVWSFKKMAFNLYSNLGK